MVVDFIDGVQASTTVARDAQKALGLDDEAMTRLLGVSLRTWQRYKKGQGRPHAWIEDILRMVAAGLIDQITGVMDRWRLLKSDYELAQVPPIVGREKRSMPTPVAESAREAFHWSRSQEDVDVIRVQMVQVKRLAQAALEYEKDRLSNSQQAELLLWWGIALFKEAQYVPARDRWQEALSLCSLKDSQSQEEREIHAHLYTNIAASYFRLSDFSSAMHCNQKALEIQEDSLTTEYNFLCIAQRMEELSDNPQDVYKAAARLRQHHGAQITDRESTLYRLLTSDPDLEPLRRSHLWPELFPELQMEG